MYNKRRVDAHGIQGFGRQEGKGAVDVKGEGGE